jgi:16S rRNA (cytosine967-C5)-methyltransferase
MNSRQTATELLFRMKKEGRYLDELLNEVIDDHAFIQSLCYGVCRYYFVLEYLIKTLQQKPFQGKYEKFQWILFVGLYQIFYTDTVDFAIVNECVNAAPEKWMRSVINAILRRALREKEVLWESVPQTLHDNHPVWIRQKMFKQWPTQAAQIIAGNLAKPPMTLRVNTQKISREDYLQKLATALTTPSAFGSHPSTEGNLCKYSPVGIILHEAMPVSKLPGFLEGEIFIQDEAAQLAPFLLDLKAHQKILDACAAPGGKLTHLLCHEPTLKVLALEVDENRCQKIQENLERLHLKATVKNVDAAQKEKWWDGNFFDRILLDVPCSASGVIRRHPDIKLFRQEKELALLIKTQKALLAAAWQTLAAGGILLYATCSIFKEENELQVHSFLKAHPDAVLLPIEGFGGIDTGFGQQYCPPQTDGFFYARLRKNA